MKDFYIDRPRSVSARIAAQIELAPASSYLLVGGVGSGKTTELLAAERRIAGRTDVTTLYVDISKQHDIGKMAPGVVVAQVGLALADELQRGGISTDYIQRARDVAFGYSEDWDPYNGQSDGEYIPGILTVPDEPPESVRRARVPFEGLLKEVRTRIQNLVVLLDGLDRMTDLQAFEQLVIHDIKVLTSLGVGVVLVGPLRTMYGLDRVVADRFDDFHYQPWIDVIQDPAGRDFLSAVLTKRAMEAFDPPGIDALVDASGGVMRDLLSLAQTALVETYMDGGERVGSHEVDDAVAAFGRKHLQGLRPSELKVLQRVRTDGVFVETSEDDLALLMTRRVLEYRVQNQPRYAVHPTIEGLLRRLAGE
ncbi:MAG TPA: hypothetical protein VFK02_30520 [Kofleriaceae bacterium]|nr:hypothetical protein [Kofleriaceae bacterium]